MPGRGGYSVTGGWATSSGGSSSSPANLSISSRYGNAPTEYVASKSVEFTTGFESGENDAFEAYLGNTTNTGGGNGAGSGYVNAGYRYGFNGKEEDDEVKGAGNSLDFGARIYDSRVGRWLTTDPLQKKYPGETPYLYTGGNPIYFKDADGRDRITTITLIHADGTPEIRTKTEKDVFNYYKEAAYGGRYAYYKSDININVFIDERGGSPATVVTTDFKANSRALSLFQYYYQQATSLVKTGDRSDQVKYGSVIYGSGNDASWSGKLPKAAEGSDSYDMKMFLDLASGLREGQGLADLTELLGGSKRLVDIVERMDKLFEAINKVKEAKNAKDELNEKKTESKKGPAVKFYFDRTSAAKEKGDGVLLHTTPEESGKPDTIFYDKPKKESKKTND
jgi:RHS repeat-associated protein